MASCDREVAAQGTLSSKCVSSCCCWRNRVLIAGKRAHGTCNPRALPLFASAEAWIGPPKGDGALTKERSRQGCCHEATRMAPSVQPQRPGSVQAERHAESVMVSFGLRQGLSRLIGRLLHIPSAISSSRSADARC